MVAYYRLSYLSGQRLVLGKAGCGVGGNDIPDALAPPRSDRNYHEQRLCLRILLHLHRSHH